jgi:hypothetical protein
MHYIRFLKPPRLLSSGRASSVVTAKVTVTTDLGESFLWTNVDLVVELTDRTRRKVIGKGKEYTWKGIEGMRSLDVELLIPASRGKKPGEVLRLLVRPKEDSHSVGTFEKILVDSNESDNTEEEGGVAAVRSMAIDIPSHRSLSKHTGARMAERTFKFGKSELHIWEETGESIARHIWYAPLGLKKRYVPSHLT